MMNPGINGRFVFHILSLLVSCEMAQLAFADHVAFVSGDSSFIGLVDANSTLLEKDLIVDGLTSFCSYSVPDRVRGCKLDLSLLPYRQIQAMRRVIREILAADRSNEAVLLCVCDSGFDFETTWLGIPYNPNRFRISRYDSVANYFGPSGAATIARIDSEKVPSLNVDFVSDEQFRVTGDVKLCILKQYDAALQRVRRVVSPDGEESICIFDYNPKQRICFETGDAFFVAKADMLLTTKGNKAVLEYYTLPRIHCRKFEHPLSGKQLRMVVKDDDFITEELTIRNKGRRLSIEGLPKDIADYVDGMPNIPWFVFVTNRDYDPRKHKLGKRYNERVSIDTKRPLSVEFAECNLCTETFPVGDLNDSWPQSLNVSWNEDLAEVSMKDVKLIFVQYWDGVPFYSDGDKIERSYFQVTDESIEHWLHGRLDKQINLRRSQP